jgi:hypothetical protein
MKAEYRDMPKNCVTSDTVSGLNWTGVEDEEPIIEWVESSRDI